MTPTPDMQGNPPDPCINLCLVDSRTGWCQGCKRTPAEIGAWPAMPPEQRRAVLAAIALRRP